MSDPKSSLKVETKTDAKGETKPDAKPDAKGETKANSKPVPSRSPALRITARVHGFRRAGVAHPAAPTEYKAGAFSVEEHAALKAEPMLVVEEL